MGSRLLNFRVPEDFAQEIEAKAAELGITVSDYLRGLCDESLYPADSSSDGGPAVADIDGVIERLERVEEEQTRLAADLELVRDSAGQASLTEDELGRVEREFKARHNEQARIINDNTAQVKKIAPIVEAQMAAVGRRVDKLESDQGKLQVEMKAHVDRFSTLISNMGDSVFTKFSDKIVPMVEKLSTEVSRAKQLAIRQPTNDYETLEMKNGKSPKFRVYKSKDGLTRPEKVSGFLSEDKYVDLAEPLN